MKVLLQALIVPPAVAEEHLRGFLDRFVRHRKERRPEKEPSPLQVYLREPEPRPCKWSWTKLHGVVMRRSAWMAQQVRHVVKRWRNPALPQHRARWAARAAWRCAWPGRHRSPPQPAEHAADAGRPDAAAAAWWQGFYADATDRAGAYADRYRSSYVAIFVLGAWALSFAVLGLAADCLHWWMAVLELASFGLILGLVHANHWHHWHQRWIEYRLLAELCRKQQALSRLGWSLAAWEVRRMAQSGTRVPPRVAWAAWFFNAAMRAAPLPRGELSGAAVAAIRATVLAAPVEEQRRYHRDRALRSLRAGQLFGYAGEGLFLVTLAIVVVKLAVMGAGLGVDRVGPAAAERDR